MMKIWDYEDRWIGGQMIDGWMDDNYIKINFNFPFSKFNKITIVPQ